MSRLFLFLLSLLYLLSTNSELLAYSNDKSLFDQTTRSLEETRATRTLQWKALRPDIHGHYWLGTRHYDPSIGSFISPDPLGHTATPSLYPYAGGDPINYGTVNKMIDSRHYKA